MSVSRQHPSPNLEERSYQTPRSTNAAKEAKDNQGFNRRRQGTTNLPDAKEGIGGAQYHPPAINLAQGGQKERADDVSEEVYADGHGAHNLVHIVEFGVYHADAWGQNGRSKRGDKGDGRHETHDEPLFGVGEVERHGGVILAVPTHDTGGEVARRDGGKGEALALFFSGQRGAERSAMAEDGDDAGHARLDADAGFDALQVGGGWVLGEC